MSLKSEPTTFALLCKSCGLSVRQAAMLLRINFNTAEACIYGRRAIPPEVMHALEEHFRRLDDVARAFRYNPERIEAADIAPVLRHAALRRVIEINLTDAKRPKRPKSS